MAATLSKPPQETVPSIQSISAETPNLDPVKHSQAAEALTDVIAGSVAGGVGKVFEYPFDTVKVRLQSHGTSVYRNAWDCFQKSVRADGVVRGLYRGLSAPVFGAAVENSSLFFSYRLSQDLLVRTVYTDKSSRRHLPMDALLIAGTMSGAFTSLSLTPIEYIKCQMQIPLAPGSQRGPGILAVVGNVFKQHGVLGFWHGQLPTLIREAGGGAAWFGAYEGTKLFFQRRDSSYQVTDAGTVPIWQQLVAGAVAGVSYNFAFFPADTIKSRMQTQQVGPTSGPATPGTAQYLESTTNSTLINPKPDAARSGPSFWSVGKDLWKEQGLKGLYRGCGITVGRSAISSPIIFVMYEYLKAAMDP